MAHGEVVLREVDFRSANKFREGCNIGIDNQKIIYTSAKYAVNIHLAFFDTDDGTGASIDDLILLTTAVTEDYDDLVFSFLSDHRLQSLGPVRQGVQIGLLRGAAECAGVFACGP